MDQNRHDDKRPGECAPHEMTRAEFNAKVWMHGAKPRFVPLIDKEGLKRGEFSPPGQWQRAISHAWDKSSLNALEVMARQGHAGAIAKLGKKEIEPEREGAVYLAVRSPDKGFIVIGKLSRKEASDDPHRTVVERALRDGKLLPPEVLKDYPDLVSSASLQPPDSW